MRKMQPMTEKNILIVDDSRTVRQLLKMVLARGLPCRIAEAEDRDKGLELGADSYLTKPFNGPAVVKTAAALLV
jgi:DNA-binding response OmpR family regulator